MAWRTPPSIFSQIDTRCVVYHHEMTAAELEQSWQNDPRWAGIRRPYKGDDVVRLRGSIHIEHTLARVGAERLWNLLVLELWLREHG